MPSTTHSRAAVLAAVALFLLSAFLPAGHANVFASSQQSDTSIELRTRGVELFNKGDLKGAIKALSEAVKQNKNDALAWYYLGLAFYRAGKTGPASKAFESAVKLRPEAEDAHIGLAYTLLLKNKLAEAEREALIVLRLNPRNAAAHYLIGNIRLRTGGFGAALKSAQAALEIDPNIAQAQLLKSQALINMYSYEAPLDKQAALKSQQENRSYVQLREAAESLEKYLQLMPEDADTKEWREQLETLRLYVNVAEGNVPEGEKIVRGSDSKVVKARILSKPVPDYTTGAQLAGVSGTVVLQMILGSDGKVRNILVLRSLGYGLAGEAVKAARKIKFTPATLDGNPVSMYVRVEYNFNVF